MGGWCPARWGGTGLGWEGMPMEYETSDSLFPLLGLLGLLLLVAVLAVKLPRWRAGAGARRALDTLDAYGVRAYIFLEPWVLRAWRSKLRRDNFSWTEFKRVNFSWRNFFSFRPNKWSRIRIYFYVGILAEFMIHAYYSPSSMRALTRIACFAIEVAGPASNVGFMQRYQDIQQAHSFQRALLRRFDANRNGRLDSAEAQALARETGLAPRELTVSCAKASLLRLVAGAHKAGVLPESVTYRMISADGYYKGVAEYERRHKEMWDECNLYLNYYWSARELLYAEGWKRGWDRFVGGGYEIIDVGFSYLLHPISTFHGAYFPLPELPQLLFPQDYAPPGLESQQEQDARARYEAKMEGFARARIEQRRLAEERMGSGRLPSEAEPPAGK
jgi:hypothetical protein